MSVTSVEKNPETLTLSITSAFDAPLDQVWGIWSDPRKLERWWGPPTWPATFVEHDLAPGGRISYFMTGPTGDQHWGWWQVLAADPPRGLQFESGFSDTAGQPNPDLPIMTIRASLAEAADDGTTMVVETTFASLEAMEQVLAMGMEQGMIGALGQIDALLG